MCGCRNLSLCLMKCLPWTLADAPSVLLLCTMPLLVYLSARVSLSAGQNFRSLGLVAWLGQGVGVGIGLDVGLGFDLGLGLGWAGLIVHYR